MSVWFIVILIVVEGCYCSNSTQKAAETNSTLGVTPPSEETTLGKTLTSHSEVSVNSRNLNQTDLEVLKIFHGEPNVTITTAAGEISPNSTPTPEFHNIASTNSSHVLLWNGTISTNHTMAEAVASSDEVLPFRLPNWAAIAAGVCLVSAVIGYISCVSYRRFLQRKYGNSQILIGEDVYDTSDLRNFEI